MPAFALILMLAIAGGDKFVGSAIAQQQHLQLQLQAESEPEQQQPEFVTSTSANNNGFNFASITTENPTYEITPCYLKSPEVNECIRDTIQFFAPKLKNNGIAQFNMPTIDPYYYQNGIFRYANVGIEGRLLIKNMYIHGISDLKLNSVRTNFTASGGFRMRLNIEFPQLRADGVFKAVAKFGALAVEPKGPFNITMDNVNTTILTDGAFVNTEDGLRVRLQRLNANVSLGKARIQANGIFSDQELNRRMLSLVNENLPEITRVGIPATRDQWAPIMVARINEFFSKVPAEKFIVQ